MIRNLTSLDTEVGIKKFSFLCDSDSSLQHCLQAIKNFESIILEKIKNAQEQYEEKVKEEPSCHIPQE